MSRFVDNHVAITQSPARYGDVLLHFDFPLDATPVPLPRCGSKDIGAAKPKR